MAYKSVNRFSSPHSTEKMASTPLAGEKFLLLFSSRTILIPTTFQNEDQYPQQNNAASPLLSGKNINYQIPLELPTVWFSENTTFQKLDVSETQAKLYRLKIQYAGKCLGLRR
jgi:hypothetical protein